MDRLNSDLGMRNSEIKKTNCFIGLSDWICFIDFN